MVNSMHKQSYMHLELKYQLQLLKPKVKKTQDQKDSIWDQVEMLIILFAVKPWDSGMPSGMQKLRVSCCT